MTQSRRDFVKDMAAAWTVSVMGALLSGCGSEEGAEATAAILNDPEITWSKAPCRFCGTGCGVMVGVREGESRRRRR